MYENMNLMRMKNLVFTKLQIHLKHFLLMQEYFLEFLQKPK